MEWLTGIDWATLLGGGGVGALLAAIGTQWRANRQQSAELLTEERKQIAGRSSQLTDRIKSEADHWRNLHEKESKRYDELLEKYASKEAQIARLEERLASMDSRLDEISTHTLNP